MLGNFGSILKFRDSYISFLLEVNEVAAVHDKNRKFFDQSSTENAAALSFTKGSVR